MDTSVSTFLRWHIQYSVMGYVKYYELNVKNDSTDATLIIMFKD